MAQATGWKVLAQDGSLLYVLPGWKVVEQDGKLPGWKVLFPNSDKPQDLGQDVAKQAGILTREILTRNPSKLIRRKN